MEGVDRQKNTLERHLTEQRQLLREQQKQDRTTLWERHSVRQKAEALERDGRLRDGMMGKLDKLTGRHEKTQKQNEREVHTAENRDRQELRQLSDHHREQRASMNRYASEMRQGGKHLESERGASLSAERSSVANENTRQSPEVGATSLKHFAKNHFERSR